MCRPPMQAGIGRAVPGHAADSLSALLHFRTKTSSNGTIDYLTDSLLTTNGMWLHHRHQRHIQMQPRMLGPMDKIIKNASPKNWDAGCKRFVNPCMLVRRYLLCNLPLMHRPRSTIGRLFSLAAGTLPTMLGASYRYPGRISVAISIA